MDDCCACVEFAKTTNIGDSNFVVSVADGTDEAGHGDAGWAPEDKGKVLFDYIRQVQGIIEAAGNLKGDHQDMLQRYRTMLEAKGADVTTFDEAVVAVCPAICPARKEKTKRARQGC